MPVPLVEIGRRGRLDITFALQNGETILRHSYCEVPFKITRVLHSRQPLAHLILMHCTAGLFGGDEIECSIRVERGARVMLTQQSATKVHPSGGFPAIQKTSVVVGPGAYLQLYLEPVIPFADSILKQTTNIEVASGGQLVFWEGFMAGRVGRGESWQFSELSTETHLRLNNRLSYLERFRLCSDNFAQNAWAMGNHAYVGTGLYVGEGARTLATDLHKAIAEAGIDSPEEHLAIARVTALRGPEFHRCREIFTQVAEKL
jgi:urease accessory protein UreH